MAASFRWIAVAFVLGLCAAYAMWGSGEAPTSPPSPPRTTPSEEKVASEPNANPVPVKTAEADAKVTVPFKFDPPDVEFGDVTVGEKKTLSVSVTNITNKTIKVIGCEPSCGCIKPEIEAGDLAAGQSREMKLTITGLAGPKERRVTVTPLTEETLPLCVLSIHVKMPQLFETDRDMFDFKKLAKGESRTIEAVLRRADGTPFKIVDWTCGKSQREEFKVKWSEIAESKGSAYRIAITATGIKGTRIADRLKIITDGTPQNSFPFIVNMETNWDARCLHERLSFSYDANKVLGAVETTIQLEKQGTLEIQSVIDDQGATITFEKEQVDPRTVKLTLHMGEDSRTHQPWGNLLIKTNSDDDPLPVPYVAPRSHAAPKH